MNLKFETAAEQKRFNESKQQQNRDLFRIKAVMNECDEAPSTLITLDSTDCEKPVTPEAISREVI